MTGTIANVAAILAGGAAGLLLKKGLPQRISDELMNALALCVLFIGISGCFEGSNVLISILSMAIGTTVGSAIDLDAKLNKFADKLQNKLTSGKNGNVSVAEGFVTATMLFCVGAMAIVGSIQSGLNSDHATLFSKAVIDGISSIVLASTLGVGVLLSAVPLLLYQGGITLLATFLAPILTQGAVIGEITCVGSMMIIAIALNMMKITNIKVMNMLPSVLPPIILCMFM
ncbi:MAG: DUF554 domain-containing protein [Anaerofustis stercorihominis]|nr:DUF554 domain-containing protein [Anaerofustis stercorihominis]